MKLKVTALALSSALVLGACGSNNSTESHSKDSNHSHQQSESKDTIALNDIKTDPQEAIDKAQQTYKDENVKEVSFEKEHGEWVYKIDQQNSNKREESEVVIRDKDKKIVSKEQEKHESNSSDKAFKYEDVKSYKDAIKAGQKKFNGDIKEWSLSKDDKRNQLVYDMDLKKGKEKHEISVDAKTGEVLSDERDD
ncbi:PepSY domain-containing protein [Staphylococcus sp. SQ8-PEA]|uniref:PepSY domain-containing protein n=1 Tax=Staphylococcus marylandisciuri TaxID=2981529 RepID=A0ABT2QSM2_9STAP|nr:PepSY domain-containing protein [Staphylococcus marylandisciuri]MCU5746983.1 PepSY domain-containing protein [Staphylococcus marylandisciuri]